MSGKACDASMGRNCLLGNVGALSKLDELAFALALQPRMRHCERYERDRVDNATGTVYSSSRVKTWRGSFGRGRRACCSVRVKKLGPTLKVNKPVHWWGVESYT